jgi:hypothetical protein
MRPLCRVLRVTYLILCTVNLLGHWRHKGHLSGLSYRHSLLVLITLQSTYLTTMKVFTRFQMSQLSSKKSDAGLGPIFVKLVEINDTAYSVYGGFLSQFGNWGAKVTIKRFNL